MRPHEKIILTCVALWITVFGALASASIPVMIDRNVREFQQEWNRRKAERKYEDRAKSLSAVKRGRGRVHPKRRA